MSKTWKKSSPKIRMTLIVAPNFCALCVVRVARHLNLNEPVKKSEREPAKPLKKQKRHFFFRGKKCGTIKSKHAKETKEREESKHRRRSDDCVCHRLSLRAKQALLK